MAKVVKVSYETITPPPEERDVGEEDVEMGMEEEVTVGGVKETVDVLCKRGCMMRGNRVQYSTPDPERNIETGEETYYNCNLEGFTEKQLAAIDMLMRKKGAR